MRTSYEQRGIEVLLELLLKKNIDVTPATLEYLGRMDELKSYPEVISVHPSAWALRENPHSRYAVQTREPVHANRALEMLRAAGITKHIHSTFETEDGVEIVLGTPETIYLKVEFYTTGRRVPQYAVPLSALPRITNP
jgi:hypothetical protein